MAAVDVDVREAKRVAKARAAAANRETEWGGSGSFRWGGDNGDADSSQLRQIHEQLVCSIKAHQNGTLEIAPGVQCLSSIVSGKPCYIIYSLIEITVTLLSQRLVLKMKKLKINLQVQILPLSKTGLKGYEIRLLCVSPNFAGRRPSVFYGLISRCTLYNEECKAELVACLSEGWVSVTFMCTTTVNLCLRFVDPRCTFCILRISFISVDCVRGILNP